ncbi:MAG: hypothetical protein AAFQ89_10980 [Cyanobacteria bacterium J06626_18]
MSIVLHIGLLFVPLPTTELVPEEEVAEEEPIPEEEEVIDLLAVSDILPPEPPPEEPAAEEPPPETPPPANPDIPPDPEQIEELLSEEVPEEFPEETEQTPSFNPAKQQEVIGRTGDINREFDQTDAFPGNVVGLPGGPEEWDTDKVNCFFAVLDFPGNHYELWPEAGLLKFFLRNNGLIVQEDLPATYPEADIIPVAPYCGEPLYLIEENGEPVMFVSVIPIGVGGSSGLLIFWTSDPSVSG